MKKFIVFAALALMSTTLNVRAQESAPAPAIDLAKLIEQLNARVTKLEADLEAAKASKPAGAWTCSAKCGGFKHQWGGGTELEGRTLIKSESTLAEAFRDLDESCREYIYVGSNGSSLVLATVQNACTYDPAGNPVASNGSSSSNTVAVADGADAKTLPALDVAGSAKPAASEGPGQQRAS